MHRTERLGKRCMECNQPVYFAGIVNTDDCKGMTAKYRFSFSRYYACKDTLIAVWSCIHCGNDDCCDAEYARKMGLIE